MMEIIYLRGRLTADHISPRPDKSTLDRARGKLMTVGGEIGPRQSFDGPTICRLAGEWLQSGKYEQAAAILGAAQPFSTQAEDALLAPILGAARRLCLACKQCQEEAEWHRQAYQASTRRERDLRQELYAILEWIGTGQAPDTPLRLEPVQGTSGPESESLESGQPKPTQRSGLWQRIRAVLGRGLPARPLPPQSTTAALETPMQPAGPGAELEQDLPITPGLATQGASSAQEPGEEAAPSLVVYCLGAFRVYQGDRLITDWNGLKGKSIFKYLLAHRETPVARDILMDLLWPDADPESARRSLHQAIYSLRQTLRRGNPDFAHVSFENDCYLLNPALSVWVDSIEFEEHLRAGSRLDAAGRVAEAIAEFGIAESLYQGDYLEEDLYEDWPAVERERLRRTYCELADHLSEHYVHNGEYTAAIALCHKILGRDNCHEPAHRRLMRCHLAQGQRHLAVRQYQTCVEVLQVELELGPSEETEAMYQDIIDTGERTEVDQGRTVSLGPR